MIEHDRERLVDFLVASSTPQPAEALLKEWFIDDERL